MEVAPRAYVAGWPASWPMQPARCCPPPICQRYRKAELTRTSKQTSIVCAKGLVAFKCFAFVLIGRVS